MTLAFDFMVTSLQGLPMPALPAIPGRLFVAPRVTDADPGLVDIQHAQTWRALSREIGSAEITTAQVAYEARATNSEHPSKNPSKCKRSAVCTNPAPLRPRSATTDHPASLKGQL